MRIDPTPRIEGLLVMGFAPVVALSARAILAMFVSMPMFAMVMRMKRMALHVNAPMEIAVGFMYHGIRKIGLGVTEQNGQEITTRTCLRQSA